MSIHSISHLTNVLRQCHLLDEDQLTQLSRDLLPLHSDPRVLAAELVRLGWLTAYQLEQLFQGKGYDLLLDSYVLLEKLGEGGMGQVFKAKNWKLGRIVAVKLILRERLADENAVRRFHREIRAATALHHPNVVHAYDADEVNGSHLLVMEYVEGLDLAKRVKQGGPLSIDLACDYVRQVALGLQHAHERGLVHRDVKPANLMLTPDGVVKILDMGLARLAPSDGNDLSGTMTAEGAVMGTPDYIAPEQALESHAVDIRADLYSLGCTLYFLLTGQVPFPGRTLTDKLLRHQLHEPQPVEELRPDVPAAVGRVVRKLMAKRPQDRYQTPAELVAVLTAGGEDDALPDGETVTVVQGGRTVARPSVEPAASAFSRREQKTIRLLCGMAGCLVLLASIVFLSFLLKPPDRQTPKEDEEWLVEVAAMPAERQVESVAAKLRERNPGFDGRVGHTIEDGVVTGFQLTTDYVTDLSPLRALTRLRRLSCGGTRGRGKLADLSPLRGMNLKELNLWYTLVSDLSPLQGMKLTVLGCGGTQIADLSPLEGMELEELNVWGTPVADLSPLRGMRLTTLACGMTQVTDLSPLKGMMLKTLHCDHTEVRDLSPLREMRLTCLSCEKTRVTDLSPLRSMPLKKLSCDLKVERDIEILRSLKTLETINGEPAALIFNEK